MTVPGISLMTNRWATAKRTQPSEERLAGMRALRIAAASIVAVARKRLQHNHLRVSSLPGAFRGGKFGVFVDSPDNVGDGGNDGRWLEEVDFVPGARDSQNPTTSRHGRAKPNDHRTSAVQEWAKNQVSLPSD
jgi:hypothetical protein